MAMVAWSSCSLKSSVQFSKDKINFQAKPGRTLKYWQCIGNSKFNKRYEAPVLDACEKSRNPSGSTLEGCS